MNDRLAWSGGDLRPDAPAGRSEFETMARLAIVLNKQDRNGAVARALDQCRNSANDRVKGEMGLHRPCHAGDAENCVLDVDNDNRLVGHQA